MQNSSSAKQDEAYVIDLCDEVLGKKHYANIALIF